MKSKLLSSSFFKKMGKDGAKVGTGLQIYMPYQSPVVNLQEVQGCHGNQDTEYPVKTLADSNQERKGYGIHNRDPTSHHLSWRQCKTGGREWEKGLSISAMK